MTPEPRRRAFHDTDSGSATVWVAACCAVVLVVATVVVLRSLAVLARHRAESGADLAALAAAGQIGISNDRSCAAAARVAVRNGARLRSCRLNLDASGRSGTVVVHVVVVVGLPVVGTQAVTASARAGRLPA